MAEARGRRANRIEASILCIYLMDEMSVVLVCGIVMSKESYVVMS